jgi:hypothetical protein
MGYLTALERSKSLPADISPGRNPGEHRGTSENHLLARLLRRDARLLRLSEWVPMIFERALV